MAISFILTIALLGIPFYGHGVSSILIGVVVIAILGLYLFAAKTSIKYQISPVYEHRTALHNDDRDRILLVCAYRNPFYRHTPMDQNSRKISSRWANI